jgi:hypothetical protein
MIGGCSLFVFCLFMLSLSQAGQYYQVRGLVAKPTCCLTLFLGVPRPGIGRRPGYWSYIRPRHGALSSIFPPPAFSGNGHRSVCKSYLVRNRATNVSTSTVGFCSWWGSTPHNAQQTFPWASWIPQRGTCKRWHEYGPSHLRALPDKAKASTEREPLQHHQHCSHFRP